ncbi:hypothetical protein DENSPDRAFT_832565, partial [Dentipellis sp. KUC8613]
MRSDAGHDNVASDDDDSLFGSPPSSPARGRSPQLALPTGPGSSENVGTIALPGSHSHIEHPLDPAALNILRPSTRPSEPPPTPSTSQLSLPSPPRPVSGRVGRPPGRASKQSCRPSVSQPVHTGVAPACVDSRYLTGQHSVASISTHSPLQTLSPFHHPHAFNLSPPPPDSAAIQSEASGASTRATSLAPSSSSSRAGSQAPRTQKAQKSKKASTSASRPPPIEIPLPDPSAPPPAGFLRNQQALLGRAGLIGKVNPANLSKHHSRGAAHNPIQILDDYDPPPIGQGSTPVDASRLPPPSSKEIITSLVRQRNIFPVLESILRLLSGARTLPAPPQPKPSAFFTRDFS